MRAPTGRLGLATIVLVLLVAVPIGALAARPPAAASGALATISGSSPAASAPAGSVLAQAIATLSHGAGPARGTPTSCHPLSATQATCGSAGAEAAPRTADHASASPPVAPTAYALTWFNVTANLSWAGAPAGYLGGIAYDPLLEEVVYFGGCGIVLCPNGDTWTYTIGGWQNQSSTLVPSPEARFGQGMDWDPALGAVVMTGGAGVSGPLNDTWLFNGTWTNATAALGAPGPEVYGSVAWDPLAGGVVFTDGCADAFCSSLYSQTWLLGATGWTYGGYGPGGAGTALGLASLAFDPYDGYLLQYGGYDGFGQVNFTYAFSGGVWYDLTSLDGGCYFGSCFTPPGRYGAAMTWDGQIGAILLTGGYNTSTGTDYNDTWVYLASQWYPTYVFLGTTAPAAYQGPYGSSMPANSTDIAPFLVGGTCATNFCYGEEWTFDVPPYLANVTVGPNPVDLNGSISVSVVRESGSGSAPIMGEVVSWGNGWSTYGYVYNQNVSANWTRSVAFTYYGYSGTGTYAAGAYPIDFLTVSGPAWTFNITVAPDLQLTTNLAPTVYLEAGSVLNVTATPSAGIAPYAVGWDFGDGTTAATAAASHAFSTPGTYDVVATASDAGGDLVTANGTVVVVPALAASPSASRTSVDVGVSVAFAGGPTGGLPPYSSTNWTFGDGGTATTVNASHTYATPGTYTASFRVVDALGTVVDRTLTVVVHAAFVASASVSPTTALRGSTVVYCNSTVAGGAAPFTYTWKFQDGTASALGNTTHTYAAAGNYTLVVWINDSGGGSYTHSWVVVVTAPPPVASTSSSGFPFALGLGALLLIVVVVVVVVLLLRRRSPPPPPGTPPPMSPGSPPAAGTPPTPPPGAMG